MSLGAWLRAEAIGLKRIALYFAGIGAAFLITACAPYITVQNNAAFPVRALIVSGGMSQIVSPSPGEASYPEVPTGPFRAVVIPDAEWIEYARATRAYLNQQLAQADNLTGPQLLEVIRRLKDVSTRIKQYESAAAGRTAISCSGSVGSEDSGVVVITSTPDGEIKLDCG